MTIKDHFDFFYFLIAFVFGGSNLILLTLFRLKYASAFLSHFWLTYLATTMMLISYFVDFFAFYSLDSQIDWIYIPLTLCIFVILYGTTTLLMLLLTDIIPSIVLKLLRFTAVIPLVYLLAANLMDRETILLMFTVISVYFYLVLGLCCIIFGIAMNRLTFAYKKLAKTVWIILSFCIVMFLLQLIFRIRFNPLIVYYILWNIALTRYIWKQLIVNGLEQPSEEKPEIKEQLTDRENEVIELIIAGKTNKGIGEQLFISEKTVKNHIYNIYKKLGIKSRFELMSLFNKKPFIRNSKPKE